MVGSHHGVFIVGLHLVHLDELVKPALGVLQRPVAMDISIQIQVLRLKTIKYCDRNPKEILFFCR